MYFESCLHFAGHDVMSLKEEDVMKMIAANAHIGSNNCDFQMLQYVYKQRSDGPFIINLRKVCRYYCCALIVCVEYI